MPTSLPSWYIENSGVSRLTLLELGVVQTSFTMPARVADAIVLRSFALKEADKIVSFFTREFGKCRGVARGARRTKNRFGAALEPLTQVRVQFFERENRDLCSLDSCDVQASMMGAFASDYAVAVALAYITEVAERVLPEHEVNERVYRLLLLTLEEIRQARPLALVLTYFLFWMVRLGGYLPQLDRCAVCGVALDPDASASFDRFAPGLACSRCRPAGGERLSGPSRAWAGEFARRRLNEIEPDAWLALQAGADLRAFLHLQVEHHIEGRIQSWSQLRDLESLPPAVSP